MAAITWKVEDFRTGRFIPGSAPSVPEAKASALTVIRRFGRAHLEGLLATVCRKSRLGSLQLWNAKVEDGRVVWKEVQVDA